jgi:hypothetical protein
MFMALTLESKIQALRYQQRLIEQRILLEALIVCSNQHNVDRCPLSEVKFDRHDVSGVDKTECVRNSVCINTPEAML